MGHYIYPFVSVKVVQADTGDGRRIDLLFPGVRIKYVRIHPRPWWNEYHLRLASWLDHYVLAKAGATLKIKRLHIPMLYEYKLKLGVKSPVRDRILPGLLEKDGTHLNKWGNCVLAANMCVPLLHCWFSYFR